LKGSKAEDGWAVVEEFIEGQQVKRIQQAHKQRDGSQSPEGSVQEAVQEVAATEAECGDATAFDERHDPTDNHQASEKDAFDEK